MKPALPAHIFGDSDSAVIHWCQKYLDLDISEVVRKNNEAISKGKIINKSSKSLKKVMSELKNSDQLVLLYILEEIYFDGFCRGKNAAKETT